MNNSVEEMVRKVAQKKRKMAEITIDGGKSGKASGLKGKEKREQETQLKVEEIIALFK
jgi:N-acetylmuramoyl-L-alanine amidase